MNTRIIQNSKQFEVWTIPADGGPGVFLQSFHSQIDADFYDENLRVRAASATSMPAKHRPV
jgi:ectoine hydroxylase-related dioxygenase (phytanoyl-CoA dioxygenase family)